jgi:hypothetical protein
MANCKDKIHGHQFVGDVCLNGCGMTQQDVNRLFRGDRKAPEPADPFAGKLNKIKKPEGGMHSQLHYTAREISRGLGEPNKFGQYLGAIKHIGPEMAWMFFSQLKEAKVKNKPALFFYKIKQMRATAK